MSVAQLPGLLPTSRLGRSARRSKAVFFAYCSDEVLRLDVCAAGAYLRIAVSQLRSNE